MTLDQIYDVPGWQELSPRDREEVWKLLSLEHNVSAVRYFRQASGVGLAQAHEAITMLLAYKVPKSTVPQKKPCPHCGASLRTALAQQCFECGADWHTRTDHGGRS